MNCATPVLVKFFSASVILFLSLFTAAQEADTLQANPLASVEVKAYGQVRRLKDVPAAVGFVNSQTLNRFNPASVVMAVNTLAGVRMEERSPGSYRFNIRGSSLRSPFGVRNVKLYFNDIPYTDPGGNTYLNALGYYNFGTLEILKGPGSSLYGAGTGGVLLVESMATGEPSGLFGEYSVGSYGLQNVYAAVTTGQAAAKNQVGFQHQVSEGYRYHSALKRDVLSWTGHFRPSENQLVKTTFLYSHHFYETPGALTKAEYEKDPRMARPAAGGFPGAEQAGASVDQKTILAGVSYTQQFTSRFSNQTAAYGMYTDFRNPAIRNYGKSTEPHFGGRTVFQYKKQTAGAFLNISLGGELQQNFTRSAVYKNNAGVPDSLQTEDDIHVRQSFIFLQGNVSLRGWELTTGASVNGSTLLFRRSFPTPLPEQRRTLNDQVMPRVALAKRFASLTVYSSVSRGFSPPTSAELLPSGSAINLSLQAEEGTNYDLGARGTVFNRLSYDVNAFFFRLKNTIVQRRDAGGGDYYVNTGSTSQKGIETSLTYSFLQQSPFFRQGTVWLNHTYHHFRYKDFKQLSNDFSGNALPGIAPHTISSGLEVMARKGWFGNLSYYFSDRLPLNDANTDYAGAYHLLSARLGYEKRLQHNNRLRLVFSVENILDQQYSLGNDINAFGGRYYNAAAGRNYAVSLLVHLFTGNEN